ncbi:chromosome partitioning protein ParA [Vibrio vulnificus]|uniref:chromosome partitioning protein ParA n=1 Tax=Vibrio vulnificus TaxID=672 RepID=UPI001029F850|nr:chromosome partitioning protein ParA [Vibrio vulnificus]RZP71502.1 chromosome partitioning protein ParA [Vibrio vulnificus]RZP72822.1 chromosome partitioning protein ParA [Vibrio vulnificus]
MSDYKDIFNAIDKNELLKIEKALNSAKKDKIKQRKSDEDKLSKSVKINLTEMEYKTHKENQKKSGYGTLSSYMRAVLNKTMVVKPIVLEASKNFFDKTSGIFQDISFIVSHIEKGKQLDTQEIKLVFQVFEILRREFQETRLLLINCFTEYTAYEIAKKHISIEKLEDLIQEKKRTNYDI